MGSLSQGHIPRRQPEGVLVLCFFIFGILTHRTGVFIAVKGVRRLSRCGRLQYI